MAIPHAKPGEVFDVRPLGKALINARTTVLVKTEGLEVIRLVVPRGKAIPTHATHGEITVQCLEGRVEFKVDDAAHEIGTGGMLYLRGEQSHSVRGIDDASILLTITFPHDSPIAERLTRSERPGPSEPAVETETPPQTELSRGRGGRVDFDADATSDPVDEASQESFPASDAPGFIYPRRPQTPS